MTTDGALDPAKVKAFGDRVLDVLNGASLAFLLSVGHKTGLLEKVSGLPPSTSAEIAEAAGLNERYVREWLGGMVVSRIMDYDPARRTYALPPEHAAVLARQDVPRMGGHLQFIPPLLSRESAILECFRIGGGVPFSENGIFKSSIPVGVAGDDARVLEKILPLAPHLDDQLVRGIDAAEVGCGTGHMMNVMARAYPRSRFVGYDFSVDGIEAGQAEAEKLGLANARFERKDLAELDARSRFDLVVAHAVIHDLAKPRAVLKAIHGALRAGGTFFMADIRASSRLEENRDLPLGPYNYLWSIAHCMTGSLADGGEGLGTMWGEQTAMELLAEAGFRDVTARRLDDEYVLSYYICRKK